MEGSSRIYQRKKYSIPFTYTAQEYPPVASSTEPLPLTDVGTYVPKKYTGTLKNSSLDGFCFETEKPLVPGTEITAEMAAPIATHVKDEAMPESKAIVRWCNRHDQDKVDLYDIGVKRIRDDKLPIFNFSKHGFASVKVM